MRSLEQLKATGKVEYAWLGVGGKALTPDVAKAANLDIESGLLIEQVVSDSPAERAGVKGGDRTVMVQGRSYTVGGDVIVKADSTEIGSFDDLVAFLSTKQPGDTVTLTLVDDRARRAPSRPPSRRAHSSCPMNDGGRRPCAAGRRSAGECPLFRIYTPLFLTHRRAPVYT